MAQYYQIVNTTIDDLRRIYPNLDGVQFIMNSDDQSQPQLVQIQQSPSHQAAAEVQAQVQAQQVQQVQAQQQQQVQQQQPQQIVYQTQSGEQMMAEQQQFVLEEPHLQPQQHQIVYPVQVDKAELQALHAEENNQQVYYTELGPQSQPQTPQQPTHQQITIQTQSPQQQRVVLQNSPPQQQTQNVIITTPVTPAQPYQFVSHMQAQHQAAAQQQPQQIQHVVYRSTPNMGQQQHIIHQTPPRLQITQSANQALQQRILQQHPQLRLQPQQQPSPMLRQVQQPMQIRLATPRMPNASPVIRQQAAPPPQPRPRAQGARAPRAQRPMGAANSQRMPSPGATIRYQSIQTPIQSPLQRQGAPMHVNYQRQATPRPPKSTAAANRAAAAQQRFQQPAATPPTPVAKFNVQIGPGQQTELKPVDAAKVTIRRQMQRSGDPDDLEESIEAAIVSKATSDEQGELPPPPPPPPENDEDARKLVRLANGQIIPMSEYRAMQRQNQQQRALVRPVSTKKVAPSTPPQTPPRQEDVRERESAKMLVILQSGEQRLITFTLPKESCTVQELLEQVGVPFTADSNIQCISNPGADIDYVVTVGMPNADSTELLTAAENTLKRTQAAQQAAAAQQTTTTTTKQQPVYAQTPPKAKSPEPPAKQEPPPKYVRGLLAVCSYCGCCSLDHARCQRCKTPFAGDYKTVPTSSQQQQQQQQQSGAPGVVKGQASDKLDKAKLELKRQQVAEMVNKGIVGVTVNTEKGRGRSTIGTGTRGGRGGRSKAKHDEHVVLELSSDEEGSNDTSKNGNGAAVKKTPSPTEVKTPLKFEPLVTEEMKATEEVVRNDVTNSTQMLEFKCRTIRIGSHKYDPIEKVVITAKGIRIVAPNVKRPNEQVVLNIQVAELVRLIYHFSKSISVMFLYTVPSCGAYVRESLEMGLPSDQLPYYNPSTRFEEHFKRIVLVLDAAPEDKDRQLKEMIQKGKLEEIKLTDANELLMRSVPRAGAQPNNVVATPNTANALNAIAGSQSKEIRNILIYPQGKGGLSINTEDYMCLAIEQYLNDVIIDFYLKYLTLEVLSPEQREKTHVFSTFFYKRLTTMTTRQRASTADKDAAKLTPAQKRHERVKNWTKSVDLFKKDFIIVPINEQSHWFLAIICYPSLPGPVTFVGGHPVSGSQVKHKPKTPSGGKKVSVQIGSTTITAVKKAELDAINLGGDESERDEAEGDDSELNSDDSDDDEAAVAEKAAAAAAAAAPPPPPVSKPNGADGGIKQSCVLIFDSLAGTSRSRVVATLRDYLTCEYKAKVDAKSNVVFNKDRIPGHCVKVPQQNNFTDCGLFLLQYVETFFKNPITDYRIPIKGLQNWFETIVVTRKREEISHLLIELCQKHHPAALPLPEISFPTLNGVLLEPEEGEEAGEFEEDEAATGAEDSRLEEGEIPAQSSTVRVKRQISIQKRPNEDKSILPEVKTRKVTRQSEV